MALPAAADFTGSTITEAQFKTAIAAMRDYLAGLLGTTGGIPAAQAALDVIFGAGVTAKSVAYTVAARDRGLLINCTGTWTLSLLAAASAGAGFAFAVRNSGSGAITIDPSAAELINGDTAFTLTAGASLVVVCTGTAWVVVGHPGELNYVKQDNGHDEIGSLCLASAAVGANSTLANPGDTIAGSKLAAAGTPGSASASRHNTALTGTWRCLGFCNNTLTGTVYVDTLWQRIA